MLSQLIAMRKTVRIRATDQCFSETSDAKKRNSSLHTDADEDAFALPVMLCRRREVFQWCYLIWWSRSPTFLPKKDSTVCVGNSSLNIQNAQTLRDDLVVPLHPEQLQVGFDFLVPAWRDNDYHCCQVLVGGGNGNSSTTEKGKVDEILLLSHHEMNPLSSLDIKSQILVSPPCFL